jgi:hypothetical protein
MFETLPVEEILPGETITSGLKLLYGFYTKGEEKKNKVVVFEVGPPEMPSASRETTPKTAGTATTESPTPPPSPPPEPLIYQVSCVYDTNTDTFAFLGREKNSRYQEELSLKWLDDNHFGMSYQRRCVDNPGSTPS